MAITVRADLAQGSEEWLDARRGMVTASMVGQLISVEAADPLTIQCPTCHAVEYEPCISAARKTPTPIKTAHPARSHAAAELPPVYKPATTDTARLITALLVAERITGWSDPVFVTADMMRGTMDEPLARDLYSRTYAPVTEVGFIVRDDWGFEIGYSPDGLVGDDGLIEVKSRRSKNHVLTIVDDEIPVMAMAQMQCGLLVSGRQWCDYISYAGGLPMWRKRVHPDRAWREGIVEAVQMFEHHAAQMLTTYTERVEGLPATERIDHFAEIEF
ncbi:MAG: YqaJ viral recombinase family protein [Propionicimonas sp.]